MLNDVVIQGRLIRDPEIKRTVSGTAVTSFTLACDRDFSNKETGDRETDFIDCVAWKGTAEFLAKYFSKGQMAVVLGRLQTRMYTDKDGNKRKTAEVLASHIYFGSDKKDKSADGEADVVPIPINIDASDFELTEGDDGDLPF